MVTFKNSSRVIRAPGTVIAAPTSLTAGATGEYGGKIIGTTRAVALAPLGTPYRIECEGLGEYSDVLEGDNRYVISFFLRGWDKSAVSSLLAAGYAEGGTTKNAVWTEPGTKTAGMSAYVRALVWLFVPDDTNNHPALIIRAGIPDFAEGAEIALQRTEEFGINIAIECLRDSNDKILDLGHLADLSL